MANYKQNKETKLIVADVSIDKNTLEKKLEAAISRCIVRYLEAGGKGLKRVDVEESCWRSYKQGVLNYSGDDLSQAAKLLNSSVGYVESIKHLGEAGLKIQAQKND